MEPALLPDSHLPNKLQKVQWHPQNTLRSAICISFKCFGATLKVILFHTFNVVLIKCT